MEILRRGSGRKGKLLKPQGRRAQRESVSREPVSTDPALAGLFWYQEQVSTDFYVALEALAAGK